MKALNYYFINRKHAPPLEKNHVRDTILEHLENLYEFYGEELGLRLARKHLSWYCKHLDDSKILRSKIVRVDSTNEQVNLVKEYFHKSES